MDAHDDEFERLKRACCRRIAELEALKCFLEARHPWLARMPRQRYFTTDLRQARDLRKQSRLH